MTGSLKNSFTARGRIVTINDTKDGLKRVTLMVKGERDVFPEICCKAELLPEFKEHAMIDVIGYVKSEYEKREEELIYRPRLMALSIAPAPTITEEAFGIKGRFWEPKPCIYLIEGTIVHRVVDVVPSGDTYIRYYVETDCEGEKTVARLDWKQIDRHPELDIGDSVCAACNIHTPKKTLGNNTKHFLNLDVIDMAQK